MTERERNAVRVREYRDGDLPGIAALQRHVEADMRCAPDEFAELWRWMYAGNPNGDLTVVVGEDAAGMIVGHEGAMPFALRFEGSTLRGAISCNLIVDEALRGTLLYPRLVGALVKHSAANGLRFLYGPARPKIGGSLAKLGYRILGPLPVYVRPYRFGGLAEHYLGARAARSLAPLLRLGEAAAALLAPRVPRGIAIEEVRHFGDDSRAFFERACAQFAISAIRTPEILNWRYFAVPRRRYTVYRAVEDAATVGYVALRRMPMLGFDALAIVDALYPVERRDVERALFAAVHRYALRSGVEVVACMSAERSSLTAALRRTGYLRAPEGFEMVMHEPKGGVRVFDDAALARWYVTWFDHDYV